jgi:uncharacterized Fe-S cluster-containing protein
MEHVYVRCPMDGTPNQKFCGLVDHYKANGNVDECPHQQECSEIKNYVINEEGNLNEIK